MAEPNVLTVKLQKGDSLENKLRMQWLITLSNSSPTAIRFSHFSLASAIRAATFFDDAGYSWQLVRTKQVIDPPSREVDFRLLVPGNEAVSFTIETTGLEVLPKTNSVLNLGRLPEKLMYQIERDIEILDDHSKKSSLWKCVGSGTANIKWTTEK